ncbi:MAG TPA: lipoprotein-releasing ABC transporter permease subunit [Candidatus Hydrogenedentes bacterium]|nr:lipoprotein-releasing ABC transporter permease subunit [Candidatus Hydrogenedentota bacterium]HPG68668.1 lipoprotein-releasing ABC transporter permease subunit [Candidatus Hydrogenedentota bacterium]
MRFETYVAFRYLRGKRKNRFVSLITVISIAGVSVGVIALIVVMSVMTGFDNALRATIIGNRAHLTIQEFGGARMGDYEQVIELVEKTCPEIVAAGPIIQIESVIAHKTSRNRRPSYAYIIGVDPALETGVTMLADNLTRAEGRKCGSGKLPGPKEVVLGYRLAREIGASVGSDVEVITDRPSIGPFGRAHVQRLWLTVSGIFDAKMSDFDSLYAFVDIPTAQMLSGREGVDGIHCKLTDPFLARAVADRIFSELGFESTTWYESQIAFFEALKQEKLVMFIILVFIILVAAFNITSTLIMVVMEKRRDIGILRTLGSSGRSILTLFVVEGLFIGLSGTLAGVILGTILAYNINPVAEFLAGLFGIDLFNSQIYYFDRIPVAVVPWDILWITVSAILLTFLSTIYPAWSASRVNPVEALRYE